MAKRQKEWARRKRLELLIGLGAACRWCGAEDELTFDCVVPQGDKHHKLDTSARISFYRFQFRLGNLQVLCARCNSRKGGFELEESDRVNELVDRIEC